LRASLVTRRDVHGDRRRLAGHAFLVIDADGTQGYQAGSDYVIEIVSPATPVDNPAIFV